MTQSQSEAETRDYKTQVMPESEVRGDKLVPSAQRRDMREDASTPTFVMPGDFTGSAQDTGYVIETTVVGEDQIPIPNVWIEVLDEQGEQVLGRGQTDDDGKLSIAVAADLKYQVWMWPGAPLIKRDVRPTPAGRDAAAAARTPRQRERG